MLLCTIKSMIFFIAIRTFGRSFEIWVCYLGLVTQFMDQLNDHFGGVSIYPHEGLQGLKQKVKNSPLEGFSSQDEGKRG